MARYVRARSAVLSPSSVDGLINDLIPFGRVPRRAPPRGRPLRQLERHHIEEFLVWNRTRAWRGRVARDQQVSASVVHGTVLTSAELPRRHHAVGMGRAASPATGIRYATCPVFPDRCRGHLPPTSTPPSCLRSADLEDPFARSAILLLRRAGCVSVNASTSSSAASSTTGHRHMVAGPARQARHRTRRPSRRRHRCRSRCLGAQRGPATPPSSPPNGRAHRLLLRRARTADPGLADPQGASGRRSGSRAHRPGRQDPASDSAQAEAHLRHRARQRRHEPPGPHGTSRPRHAGDDAALRDARLADPPRRLRRGHRARSRRLIPVAPAGRPARAGQGRMDRVGVPEDPPRRAATAPATSPPKRAPTPTSARHATTSCRDPSSPPPCGLNSVTSERSKTTPNAAAGSVRPPVINGSSMPSTDTSVDSTIDAR